jgi:hypothetical protein
MTGCAQSLAKMREAAGRVRYSLSLFLIAILAICPWLLTLLKPLLIIGSLLRVAIFGNRRSRLFYHPRVWKTGAGTIFKVDFPDYWQDSSKDRMPLNLPGRYQVRSLTEDDLSLLLFRMEDDLSLLLFRMESEAVIGGEMSRNVFSVTLKPKLVIREASLSEWSSGVAWTLKEGTVVAHPRSDSSPKEVEYKGGKYPRSGESWGGGIAQLSPDGRWLVVVSQTGEGDYRPNFFIGGDTVLPSKGSIYLDIYDVQQPEAEKKAVAQLKYKFKTRLATVAETLWLENQYLIVSTHGYLTSCIIWEKPAGGQ